MNILKKKSFLSSPAAGDITEIETVRDEVFSKKILGEGFAVIPCGTEIVSPADGTVTDVAETLHAYCIASDDGLDIIVHIGIDTVELKGSCFMPRVKCGDRVSRGALLAEIDAEKIKSLGYDPTVIVAVTNSQRLKSFSTNVQQNAARNTPSFSYTLVKGGNLS